MRLIPRNDLVLIEMEDTPNQTKSGLILTDKAKKKPIIGTIIDMGDDVGEESEDWRKDSTTSDLHVGDKVLFQKYTDEELDPELTGGKKLVGVKASDIMFRLVEE